MNLYDADEKKSNTALNFDIHKVSISYESLFPVQNILVLPLPGVGDTLNTCPALEILRKAYPKANITLVVMFKAAYDVMENNPIVDEIIYWPFIKKGFWKSVNFLVSLNKRRFDVAILSYPANRVEYNIVSFFTGVRLRIAHRYLYRTWRSLFFINSRTVLEDDRLHNVEENIRLLSLLGIHAESWGKPEIRLSEKDLTFARSWIKEQKLGKKPLIAFHPGCATFKNQIKRRWAREKYIELGRKLIREEGVRVLVFGSTREYALKKMVADEIGEGAYAVYESTMTEAAALIKRCRIMVSGDTGLMHVSGAVDVPVIAIFGPTNINWVYPYGATYKAVSKNLPCSPCFHYSTRHLTCDRFGDFRCITQITVEEVFAEVNKFLHKSKTKAPTPDNSEPV